MVRSLKSRSGMTGSRGDPRLDVHRGGDDQHAGDDHERAGGGDPVEALAGQGDPDQQDRDAADDEGRAGVVDGDLALDDGQLQPPLEHDERGGRDGERGEEAAAPAQRAVDDEAADEGAADGGEGEDRADVAAVAAALARADHARDDDLHQRGEAADAEALEGARPDQHRHARRERRHQGAGGVDHQRRLDQHLLAEQVGQLAPDRGGGRHRQQRGHDDPGVAGLAALEVGHDARQRVGHDGAGDHRHEHRQQQAAERLEHLAVRHGAGLGRGGCVGRPAAGPVEGWDCVTVSLLTSG